MPRSFGGGGKSSSASSGSNCTKNAATLRGLSALNKNLERFFATGLNECQFTLELFEKCMSKTPASYAATQCDVYRKMLAPCGEIKRDPRVRKMAERHKKWEESQQREAVAAGFANMFEYWRHQHETNPSMCRIIFEIYNECLSKNRPKESCEHFRNKCPQFK